MRWFAWLVAATAFGARSTPGFQLPIDVLPLSYRVELQIDPAKDTFQGEVSILMRFVYPTSTIWLNARDLEIESASLSPVGGERPVLTQFRVVGKELLAVDNPPSLQGIRLSRLILRYHGHIDDKAVLGAYRRKVEDRWYVYTTFTPIEARRVIPCFDEPQFKTPWELSIKIPPGQKAFSNAPETGESITPDGQNTVHFAETKPLPAELVAFAVGPFDVYQGKPAPDGTPVRAITPKDQAEQGKAAADTTVAILPRLEAYTGIPYAFGKIDHLALADAGFGAVENPGLIVYLAREMLMLPGSETVPRIHALHLLEAHELAHQWFGDLVTQATWSDVWLSEGFATWFSEKVMDQEDKPERAHLGLIEARERIMETDSSRRTRAVRVEPHDRQGTLDIYNRFVYDKGGSVLMMLEAWLGEDKFRDGLRIYLHEHQFGNASTNDLAVALKRATGVDPTPVLHSFLDATGVPRVSAQIECAPGPRVTLHQNGSARIPVCLWGPGVPRSCTVLDGPARTIDLPNGSACPGWIEANAGGTGYYRTSWTAAQLTSLALKELSPAERLTLAYDLRAMPPDKAIDKPAAHAMLAKLASDSEPEVARAAQDGLTASR